MSSKGINGPIWIEHPSVQGVLEIAEEILSENRVLNIDNLYTIAKRRLKIPRRGLLRIIQFLLDKKILVEGSKYTKETVLSNKVRKQIYKFILDENGVNFSLIKKNIAAVQGTGQVVWHLEMLLKFRFIKKLKIGNYTIFMPIETSYEVGSLNFFLKDQINEKIVILLGNKEKIKRSDVYKIIEEKREQVYYRIRILNENKIILFNKDSEKEIMINPKFHKIISELLPKMSEKYKNINFLLQS